MKFMIKSNTGSVQKENDGTIIRYTGNAEPFKRGDEMAVKKIGEDKNGPKLEFTTGLEENKIKYYGWFTPEQKEEYLKLLENYKPNLEDYYGGAETLDPTNKYFWLSPERNRITITNESLNRIFDMKNVEHAMFYFNVMGGAFLEVIAPTQTMAEVKKIPHYLVLETENTDEEADDYVTKADAYANLRQLDKEEGGDALLYLAWILQNKSKGFGAYSRSSTKSELIKYHGEFIEGKLTKTRRNCPKDFLLASDKWKEGGLVREALQVEAYLKAAEYYSFLNTNRENKYELPSGVILGASMEEAIDTIRKPKNRKDLDTLRNFVENKWKE